MGLRGFDLIIIGGGASGTAMFQALASSAHPPMRVALLERSATLGPGLPYGETAHPLHTMGRTRTRRHEKGQQLRARFAGSLDRLRQARHSVEVLTGTEVRSLARTAEGWSVATDASSLQAPRVVLATGHWHVERLRHLDRAVDWRWDVRRLEAIADEEDVVVLGMGQSGLDVAVALAERRKGSRTAGKIRLASRLGLLPAVFGHIGPRHTNGAMRALEALVERDTVRLDDVVAAVRAGAEAIAGKPLPPWTAEALQASTAGVHGVELLRADIRAAAESIERRSPIPWHPVLWHGMELFHALLPKLCAEDRLLLASHSTPVMRHAEAIHLEAAERILDYADRGLVEVIALGDAPVIGEDARGVWVRGSKAEVRGARIVDARGPDPRIALSDDALLKSLLEQGVVTAGRVPFLASPGECAVPEGWRVESVDGRDWLLTGGLWVDPQTFAALDRQGRTHGLYAMGPLTLGQFPFYAGIWATRRAAKTIGGQATFSRENRTGFPEKK